jgi:uncharacterized membrane protein (Fun14 family)
LLVEDFLFSAGGGFLFGAVSGYAIKKVMKIAAVVVGLFVAGLAFLAYKGWIDVKWTAMEISTRSTLEKVTTQLMHTVTNTASHSSTITSSGLPLAAGIGATDRPCAVSEMFVHKLVPFNRDKHSSHQESPRDM